MAHSKLRIHMVLANLQAHTDLKVPRTHTAQASHRAHTDLSSLRARTVQASHQALTDLSSQRAHTVQESHQAPTAHSKLRTHTAQASHRAHTDLDSQRVLTVPASLQALTDIRRLRIRTSLSTPTVSLRRAHLLTNQRDHQADMVLESHQDMAPSSLGVIYLVVSLAKTCLNPIHTTCSTKDLHRNMVAIVNRANHRAADTVHQRLLPLRHRRTPSRLAPRLQTVMRAPTQPQATNPHSLATAVVIRATITHMAARHRRS